MLTTLHTNSAADAVVRLADMGIEPFLIAASLRGVLGQRLVRRLCQRCKAPDPGQAETTRAIVRRHGLGMPEGDAFHRSVGCPACGQTGFRGRIGVFEVLRVDPAIGALIGARADTARILQTGRTTMLEDGLAKASLGLTTVDEVLRTVG